MPTTNVRDPEARVEAAEEEIDELTRRRAEALAQIQRAETRFGELEERRSTLSPKTFSGDKKATAELEALEDEHDQLARSVRVARSALPEFDRMLAEAKTRASEARTDIHRERYRTLIAEGDALTPKIEELGGELNGLLERRAALYHDAAQELRYYDQDGANSLALGNRSELHRPDVLSVAALRSFEHRLRRLEGGGG